MARRPTVRDVMTPEPIVLEATATVSEAARAMREGGRPVGIVSLGDLAVVLDRESALAKISAAPPSS